MMGLTKRQSEALAFIAFFVENEGYSPTLVDICIGLGMSPKSKGAAHALVDQLVKRGRLTKCNRMAGSIKIIQPAAAA